MVGIGNPVRGDDSVGLVVARRVREAAGDGLVVEELWTGGLKLAEALVGFEAAVVVDATSTGGVAPGTVRLLEAGDYGSCLNLACLHDATLPDALCALKKLGAPLPSRVWVVGVEIELTDHLSEELTPAVSQAVCGAVEAVFSVLDRGE